MIKRNLKVGDVIDGMVIREMRFYPSHDPQQGSVTVLLEQPTPPPARADVQTAPLRTAAEHQAWADEQGFDLNWGPLP